MRFRLEMLQCGDEREPDAVAVEQRIRRGRVGSARSTRRSAIGVTQAESSTDGPRSLSPDDGGENSWVACAPCPSVEQVEANVGRDPEPSPSQLGASLGAVEAPPSPDERLLQSVFGFERVQPSIR